MQLTFRTDGDDGALAGRAPDRVQRTADTGWLRPDEVRLVDQHLEWKVNELPTFHRTRSGRGMLTGFLKLANDDQGARRQQESPDADVLRYAQRWGYLGLCSHGVPRRHLLLYDPANPYDQARPVPGCLAVSTRDLWLRESVSAWRMIASDALTVRQIAKALHGGNPAAPELWAKLAWEPSLTRLVRIVRGRPGHPATMGTAVDAMAVEQAALGELVTNWLAIADVRPVLWWGYRRKPDIELTNNGLFGALAIRLLLAASNAELIAECDGCGLPMPDVSTRSDRRNYCETCFEPRALRARRDWAQAYRKTQKYRDWYARRQLQKKQGKNEVAGHG